MQRFRLQDDYLVLGATSSEYQVAWDYEENVMPDLRSVEAYERAYAIIVEELDLLAVENLMLCFVESDELGAHHLARYINGTRNSPVIVITDRVVDFKEALITLYHEIGHAYFDMTDFHPKNEEATVEDFARCAYRRNLTSALVYITRKYNI